MSFDSNRSANSGSNSKRSFNSISSNPSSSNKKANSSAAKSRKNDKKKTNQKTLGMAWGANSHSSSRSAFRNSPFSDFGSYMVLKNKKLHEQFDAEASSSSQSGSAFYNSIFQGVSIFVDGYTIPSSQELRGYMLKYGGRFENYFSRHHVSHIICSNLPDSKIKNLRSFSGGLPVVKPTWVQDSIAANKLLSWIPYQLDQLASEIPNQPKLSAFFPLKISRDSDDVSPNICAQEASETENSSLKGGTLMVANFSEKREPTKQMGYSDPELNALLHEYPTEMILEEPACSVGTHGKGAEQGEISMSGGSNAGSEPKSSSCQASASVCNGSSYGHNSKESSSSRISLACNQPHSTLTDPNFVENYFKNSRLHFIGTWRSRYRKRYPSSSNRFKYKNCCLNPSGVVQKTAIIHVDMDCFFVAVVIKGHPELQDKPVAVCHSDSPCGTAEISSANYPARHYGVKAGMFVKDAKARCPHLVVVPYDFGAYEKVADQFYDILHKHCNKVQAVSCDEAFLDVTESTVEDPQLLASLIRKEILDATGCTASAGIAGNMLMARLATKTAKPDGQCYIPPEKVDDYLCALPVRALPGIGRVLTEKLDKKQIETCRQLRMVSKETLQKDFGMKTGDMLWNYSRGIDNRLIGVIQESKSIGAEVNWGVRFRNKNDTQHFLMNLCKEVSLRLQGCGVQGRSFTLKIKKRRSDAGEPIKYMGCGDCENLSHSITIPTVTDEVDVLQRIATQLFGYFHIDVKDIRGMGLQVSKLESADTGKLAQQRNSIHSWLVSNSAKARDQEEVTKVNKHADIDIGKLISDGDQGPSCSGQAGPSAGRKYGLSGGEGGSSQDVNLPPLRDLDVEVIESLPPNVIAEINDMYRGELTDLISKFKSRTVGVEGGTVSSDSIRGIAAEAKDSRFSPFGQSVKISVDNEENQYNDAQTCIRPCQASVSENITIMPLSLSQVDPSVLQQLPEELRLDILGFLPAHQRTESLSDGSVDPMGKQTVSGQFVSDNELWAGSPPMWVDKFKASSFGMLNMFAEMYYRSRPTYHLSSMLQRLYSETSVPLDTGTDEWDDVVSCLCKLVKQYVELKIQTDIEEIYFCICLLRRLAERSKLFRLVHDSILPHLQASVGENYGGTLRVSSVMD